MYPALEPVQYSTLNVWLHIVTSIWMHTAGENSVESVHNWLFAIIEVNL
jgi:hypothetical protein